MHELVGLFCTPPAPEITNFDLRSIASAKKDCLDFEGSQLPVYSWGEGKKVLLAHGWGSRASHLSLLARLLADSGYNVYAFDAPAHSSESLPLKDKSSMFEYGRALSAAANYVGDIHAVVGHSLGAITSIFTLTGYEKFSDYKFNSGKLVLISVPSSMEELIIGFARERNLSEEQKHTLRTELEREFNYKVADYGADKALRNNPLNIMIVHDENDEDMHISNAYKVRDSLPSPSKTFFTKGLGHRKILLNRDAMKAIANFINE